MKTFQKTLLICLCAAGIVAASVLGTLAYLTDKEAAVNTFTVGQVDITVDEAEVTPDGIVVEGADRVKENKYHLIPGQTYTKDPTLTVNKDSEEAYVRMLVTVNCASQLDAIFAPSGADLTSIFGGYDPATWIYDSETRDDVANTVTYVFRYKETVKPDGTDDVQLEALFSSFTIPGTLDGEDLKSIEELTITVEGHAIQAVGFADETSAWAAFDAQYSA